jgi:hypothetical protein
MGFFLFSRVILLFLYLDFVTILFLSSYFFIPPINFSLQAFQEKKNCVLDFVLFLNPMVLQVDVGSKLLFSSFLFFLNSL